ncbi:MAG: hypothetical protein JF591_14090 [Lysobacter sp.]|nr:hypothetical protein [Lysobacter sp.]
MTVALTLSIPAVASDAASSRYSSLVEKDCVADPAAKEDDGQGGSSVCPGVDGYRLRVVDGDARMSIEVLTPAGKTLPLDFWSMVTSGFSSVGDIAEWRYPASGGRVPQALIVRLNVSENPERPGITASYLVVSRLGVDAACVTAKIAPGKAQNEAARKAADVAAASPCLPPMD